MQTAVALSILTSLKDGQLIEFLPDFDNNTLLNHHQELAYSKCCPYNNARFGQSIFLKLNCRYICVYHSGTVSGRTRVNTETGFVEYGTEKNIPWSTIEAQTAVRVERSIP